MVKSATMSVAEARTALKRLQENVAAADPHQPASPGWIKEMHDALKAVASRENVQRYRLDGLQGVNMAYLHHRVQTLLLEFENLAANPPRQ